MFEWTGKVKLGLSLCEASSHNTVQLFNFGSVSVSNVI